MKLFVRQLIRLLIPVVLECLDEALNPAGIQEGRRVKPSKKAVKK